MNPPRWVPVPPPAELEVLEGGAYLPPLDRLVFRRVLCDCNRWHGCVWHAQAEHCRKCGGYCYVPRTFRSR